MIQLNSMLREEHRFSTHQQAQTEQSPRSNKVNKRGGNDFRPSSKEEKKRKKKKHRIPKTKEEKMKPWLQIQLTD